MVRIDACVQPDVGGAVSGQGVVKPGARFQCIDLVHIRQEQSPAVLDSSMMRPIDINILRRIMAIIGAQPDDIPLICYHVVEFILTKEPFKCRIPFSLFLARFYGNSQIIAAGKCEAKKYMRYGRTHPVNGYHIHCLQFAQVETFVVIGGGTVGFAAVLEIAYVVYCDTVAVYFGP